MSLAKSLLVDGLFALINKNSGIDVIELFVTDNAVSDYASFMDIVVEHDERIYPACAQWFANRLSHTVIVDRSANV